MHYLPRCAYYDCNDLRQFVTGTALSDCDRWKKQEEANLHGTTVLVLRGCVSLLNPSQAGSKRGECSSDRCTKLVILPLVLPAAVWSEDASEGVMQLLQLLFRRQDPSCWHNILPVFNTYIGCGCNLLTSTCRATSRHSKASISSSGWSLETEQLLLLAVGIQVRSVGMSKVAETRQFVQTSSWTLIPAAERRRELTS